MISVFTQILFSYCPGPNPIRSLCRLVHCSKKPCRNKIQRGKSGRMSVAERNRSGPGLWLVKWFLV